MEPTYQHEALPSDAQICQWMAEAGSTPTQRYWGETVTCPSVYQLRRESLLRQKQSETKKY